MRNEEENNGQSRNGNERGTEKKQRCAFFNHVNERVNAADASLRQCSRRATYSVQRAACSVQDSSPDLRSKQRTSERTSAGDLGDGDCRRGATTRLLAHGDGNGEREDEWENEVNGRRRTAEEEWQGAIEQRATSNWARRA